MRVRRPFRWGSEDLCLGKPKRFRVIQRDSEKIMVQDQFREFSEMFQRFFSFLLGKHASRDPRSPGKMFRELLRLRNSWKISSRIISSCQRIQMEIIMIKTIQEYCLVFLWSRNGHTGSSSWPKPIQRKEFTRQQSLRIFYRITTGPWRNLGRRHTWQTICRLWVTSCFPSGGSGYSSLRPFSTKNWNCSVQKNCKTGFCCVHTDEKQ